MTWWNIINSCLCLWHYFKKITVSLIGPFELSKCKDNIFRYYKTSDGENRNPSHCDDIIVVVWCIVECRVTMKYWLAARQPGHTFNDRQHFWCSHSKNWSGLITKTNYKSRLIISPVSGYFPFSCEILIFMDLHTFNTFNGQFVSYFMASTIKLNCCAANVCISPSPTISQLNYRL